MLESSGSYWNFTIFYLRTKIYKNSVNSQYQRKCNITSYTHIIYMSKNNKIEKLCWYYQDLNLLPLDPKTKLLTPLVSRPHGPLANISSHNHLYPKRSIPTISNFIKYYNDLCKYIILFNTNFVLFLHFSSIVPFVFSSFIITSVLKSKVLVVDLFWK